jgi:T-complex protein 1 subunit eta
MVVSAVEKLDKDLLDRDLIGVKLVTGGSITDSFLVDGVAFKKTFSYAGFEQAPKKFKNPKICVLNIELEKKSEKENAEIRIDNPEVYQSLIDAEWDIIYNKLKAIVEAGANIVLSRLPIGDLAQQYFSDRGIFSAGRVPQEVLISF